MQEAELVSLFITQCLFCDMPSDVEHPIKMVSQAVMATLVSSTRQ